MPGKEVCNFGPRRPVPSSSIPRFTCVGVGRGSLEQKDGKRIMNPRPTHPKFIFGCFEKETLKGKMHKEGRKPRSTYPKFILGVLSQGSITAVMIKGAKQQMQDLPIQSSFLEVFEQETLKRKSDKINEPKIYSQTISTSGFTKSYIEFSKDMKGQN